MRCTRHCACARQRATGTLVAGHAGRIHAAPSRQTARRAGPTGRGRAERAERRDSAGPGPCSAGAAPRRGTARARTRLGTARHAGQGRDRARQDAPGQGGPRRAAPGRGGREGGGRTPWPAAPGTAGRHGRATTTLGGTRGRTARQGPSRGHAVLGQGAASRAGQGPGKRGRRKGRQGGSPWGTRAAQTDDVKGRGGSRRLGRERERQTARGEKKTGVVEVRGGE
jgi:translation initiation factor IF-2